MRQDAYDSDDQAAREAERLAIRKRAMDLLARREHARAELQHKLSRHEHHVDDIAAVLDALVDDGLLSDARFAEASVLSKARRGIGPMRIRAELRQAGVNDAAADIALENVEFDWAASAAAAREKRFGPDMPADFPTRAKQMRFLQRRGFDSDQIAHVFDND
ncbi:regulatory protein RecX [Salinisphaera sp. Q1T1-3]|uniref:regulatory protein RecX n=1 Tax=Salinisphaera sp. Q1T1-3 TaxID=2321229 RepID=UPI000E71822A|nr:regulatory protein RecX [Salinisphaera sp. Q1T1-3]RJS94442.1 regulatory protein RecX [Salinisphaera sp. Q1T1-3]